MCLATKAQNKVEIYLQHADSLFKMELYAEAAIAYERSIYAADTNRTYYHEALLKKAFAYKATGQFSKAFLTLQRTDLLLLSDSVRWIVVYETILNAYLSGMMKEAERELLQIEHLNAKDTVRLNDFLFLKILVLNELQQWESAKQSFEKFLELHALPTALSNEYYAFLKNPKLKNPQKARTLSTFIPGAGQIYGGNIGQGLVSLGLQLGLLGFGAFQIWQGYYITGFASGLALLQAFYFGGIENAESATIRKNKEKIARYNGRVKSFVLDVEAGE